MLYTCLFCIFAGANDWQWLYDCVPDKLKSLHKEGYRIVFFTNQAGIEKNKTTPQAVMDRVDGMCRDLDIPVFVSKGGDHQLFRIQT